MKYVDAELLKSKTAPSFTGQNKKTWEQIKTINGIRLFDNVSSTKLINGVRYEKADYVGLTFDFSISKKHRLKINNEIYEILDQAVMGSINTLILSKVTINE